MERVATTRWLCSVFAAACWLSVSTLTSADEFFTDFDTLTDVNTADTFTVTQGSLSVEFAGGTVYDAAAAVDLSQSGNKSWMIDPVGIRDSGGMATATLSEGATRLALFGRTEAGGIGGVVSVYDEAGGLIDQGTATEINWAGMIVVRDVGESLIKSVVVVVDGGSIPPGPTQRVAIDDFEFSTGTGGPGAGDPEGEEEEDLFDDSTASLATGPFVLFLLGVGWFFASASRCRD